MGKPLVRYSVAVLLLSLVSAVSAGAFFGKKSDINTTWGKVAIKGTDPVAYFTEGKPLKGKKQHEFEWKGAKWRFANAKHLEMFKAEPEAYAPQYGGY